MPWKDVVLNPLKLNEERNFFKFFQNDVGIVLTNDNLLTAGPVVYMPIYMLMSIRRFVESKPQIVIPDLTGLV